MIFEKRGDGNEYEGIELERLFVKLRVNNEKKFAPEPFKILDIQKVEQALIYHDERQYDKVNYEITVLPRKHAKKYADPAMVEKYKITFTETFWFDISNFFGM